MTVEIPFPIEVLVEGGRLRIRRRHSGRARECCDRWKETVKDVGQAVLPEGYVASGIPAAITLFYFPTRSMDGDLDNIIKPGFGGLWPHIFLDDRQVERLVVLRFEPTDSVVCHGPTATLLKAREADSPILYVRIDGNPLREVCV